MCTTLFTFDNTVTIRRFPYTAEVTTLETGAGVIRHKQEAAGFGPQLPQRALSQRFRDRRDGGADVMLQSRRCPAPLRHWTKPAFG